MVIFHSYVTLTQLLRRFTCLSDETQHSWDLLSKSVTFGGFQSMKLDSHHPVVDDHFSIDTYWNLWWWGSTSIFHPFFHGFRFPHGTWVDLPLQKLCVFFEGLFSDGDCRLSMTWGSTSMSSIFMVSWRDFVMIYSWFTMIYLWWLYLLTMLDLP